MTGDDVEGALFECRPAGAREGVERCIMPIAHVAMLQGSQRVVVPLGLRTNASLSAIPDLQFTSDNPQVAVLDDARTLWALAVGRATITATADAGACSFITDVMPPLESAFRVGVYDARDGTPLRARVEYHSANGGAVAVDTNATGIASRDGADTPARVVVTAYPDNPRHPYAETSVVAPAVHDIGIALEPVVVADEAAALSGTFDTAFAVPPSGDVKIGLARTALDDVPPRVNADALEGRPVPIHVRLESIGIEEDTFIGSNAYAKLGQEEIKPIFTTALGGPCTEVTPCATLSWALGGQLALAKIGPWFSAALSSGQGDTGPPFIHELLSEYSPRFYHDISPVLFVTGAPNAGPSLVMRPAFDADHFRVRVPVLPARPFGGAPYDRAIAMIGPIVDGIGWIPAGAVSFFEACRDDAEYPSCHGDDGDGLINCTDASDAFESCASFDAGEVWLPMAPPHDGLEGRPLLAVVSAASLKFDPRGTQYASQVFATSENAASITFDVERFAGFVRADWRADQGELSIVSVDGCDALKVRVTHGSVEEVTHAPCRDNQVLKVAPGADSVVIEQFDFRTGGYASAHAPEFGRPQLDNLSRWTRQPCDLPPLASCGDDADCPAFLGSRLACDSGVCTRAEVGVSRPSNAGCASGYRSDVINGVVVCRWLPPCRRE